MLHQPPLQARRPYLFVDGNNASRSAAEFVEHYWPGDKFDMDWARLASQFHKTFVYDALPVQKQGEDGAVFQNKLSDARDRLSAISRAQDTHVRTGLTRAEGLRGTLRQKGVDIQLAVDALSMAHRGAYNEAVIWTSDLDFLPLFEELVLMGVTVTLWYPPKITSETLLAAADRVNAVTPTLLYQYMTTAFTQQHPFPSVMMTPDPMWVGIVQAQWPGANEAGCYIGLDGALRYLVFVASKVSTLSRSQAQA